MIARRPDPSSRPLAAARRMHLDSRLSCKTAPGCGGRRPPARLDPHHPAPFSPPSPPAPRAWVRQVGAATGSARCGRATRRAPLAWTRTGGASAPARSLSSTSPPCRKAAPALESAPARPPARPRCTTAAHRASAGGSRRLGGPSASAAGIVYMAPLWGTGRDLRRGSTQGRRESEIARPSFPVASGQTQAGGTAAWGSGATVVPAYLQGG